jgi:hypothetical protein
MSFGQDEVVDLSFAKRCPKLWAFCNMEVTALNKRQRAAGNPAYKLANTMDGLSAEIARIK